MVCRNEFTVRSNHQVRLGKEWRARFTCHCGNADAPSAEVREVHRVSFIADLHGVVTCAQHIWQQQQIDTPVVESSTDLEEAPTEAQIGTEKTLSLRVMTYNIWHNNPPDWLLHNR